MHVRLIQSHTLMLNIYLYLQTTDRVKEMIIEANTLCLMASRGREREATSHMID